MTGKFEDMSPAAQRSLYRDLFSAYLSHATTSEQAKGLRMQMDQLLSLGKISREEAAAMELQISALRKTIERELQEAIWRKRLGFPLKLQY